jgi:hypothetical protein
VRRPVPAGQRLIRQFDRRDLPAIQLRASGGAAEIEITLVVFQRHDIGRLIAHRQLDPQILAIEGKTADIERCRELAGDTARHLDTTVGVDPQAERRVAGVAALVDHIDLGHPELGELGLRVVAAQDPGRTIGFRRRPAQAQIDPAQAQIDGGLERAGILAERLDREEGDADLDLDRQPLAGGQAGARRFDGHRHPETGHQPQRPGEDRIPDRSEERGGHAAPSARARMRSW